jgi:hypothetical protein
MSSGVEESEQTEADALIETLKHLLVSVTSLENIESIMTEAHDAHSTGKMEQDELVAGRSG